MFFEEFSDLLERYACVPGDLILTGYFNFHFEDTDDTNTTRLRDILETFNMIQHEQDPTHERGHMLDLCIYRADTCVQDASVEDVISDHHMIQSSLTEGRPAFPRENISYRKIRSVDNTTFAMDRMANELLQHTCVTLHGLVDEYNSTLSRLLDEYTPLKTKNLTIRPDAPRINTDILEARKVRRQLERHWGSTRLTGDNDRFNEQRQTVKKMIFTAKSLFHTTQINKHSTDLKSLFRVTSSIMGMTKVTVLPKHDSLSALLDRFNEFFVQKIVKIRQNMNQEDSTLSPYVPVGETVSSVTVPELSNFTPATMQEVEKLTKRSPAKSCGLDPVPTWLLKQHAECLVPIITNIVNMTLADGGLPDQFKTAQTCPLIKKARLDCNALKNYTPVSNLPYISKIVEKVFAARLQKHLQDNQLYEPM